MTRPGASASGLRATLKKIDNEERMIMDDAELKAIRERLIAERDAARQDRDEWKALHGRAVHEMQARIDQQERANAELRRAYEHACEQRDKYMRRTAEWRQAACTGCANGCEGCDPMEGRNHV